MPLNDVETGLCQYHMPAAARKCEAFLSSIPPGMAIKKIFKKVLKNFIIVLICLVLLWWVLKIHLLMTPGTGYTTIINQSGETIKRASIYIGKQHFEFRSIKPNEEFTIIYRIYGTCYHTFAISFGSGKELRHETAYVMGGDERVTYIISVTGSKISVLDVDFE